MKTRWSNVFTFLASIALLILFLTLNDAPAIAQGSGVTVRVSVASDGAQGNAKSWSPAISADGRYVVFVSKASNLVGGDNNNFCTQQGEPGGMVNCPDIFVHDRQTGQTTRISVASGGGQSNGPSDLPVISADGRYVVFESRASNLVSNDSNNFCNQHGYPNGTYSCPDIFVHDRQTGQTTRVSVASTGTQANSLSRTPAISADGRYITFYSFASNLVDNDTNGQPDSFVHDRQTGQTTRVSVASDGGQGNGQSEYPNISADGRYVAFWSSASNLVSGDTNNFCNDPANPDLKFNCPDVFIHDRQTGQTQLVSVASDGSQGANWSSDGWGGSRPAISTDGRYVAFDSDANNLVSGDTNFRWDIFIHDRQTGETNRVSVASNGAQGNENSNYPYIIGDGHYVAFES